MGIYRCNKCGHLSEHHQEANMAEVACTKCGQPTKVYDTVFFVQKLLERYFAANRELQALKESEGESVAPAAQSEADHNSLSGVDLAATDILANAQQHEPLKEWFVAQQIVPSFDYAAVDMSGYFDEAAEDIGGKYHLTKDVLGRIGWAYRNNHTGINLNLDKMSQQDAQTLNNMFRRFYSHTLFAKYFYQKQEKVVRLTLQNATAIKHFFSGGWLEWFALGKILAEAKQRGGAYSFSCARNVKIRFNNEDVHELDVVFLPRGRWPLVVECKSGEFRRDIEKYVRLKKRLNLPDSHFILLVTNVEESQVKGLSSMYGLTFVTPKGLSKHIQEVM